MTQFVLIALGVLIAVLTVVAVLDLLPPLFGTRETVLPVHATGRGAMEATLCNLLAPGDAIGVCANGRFGELWGKLGDSLRLRVHRIATNWDADVEPAEGAAA